MTNPDRSPITSDDIDTYRDENSSGAGASMTTATLLPIGQTISPAGVADGGVRSRYRAPMSTAHDIAEALRERLRDRITYLPDRKLHALLYLAQGLGLADDDEPLFPEPIIATELGVRVDLAPAGTSHQLSDTEFATVAVTAGRYGSLSAMDLEALIRGQGAWAGTGTDQPIDLNAIREIFRRQDETPEGTLSGIPRSHRTQLHPPFKPDAPRTNTPDSPEEIAAFIADVQARM